MPLAWRVFVVNAVVFTAGTAALALSPATVSFPIALTEALVLVTGLSAILLLNLVLVRRSLQPLERLTSLMRRVDLLRPGERLDLSGPAEARELGAVFNEMLDRLERERREAGHEALRAQENERKRVAQELHDEVGQAMTALMLQLARLAKHAPEELQGELREAQDAVRATLEDVRGIARQLRPEALDDLGLPSALTALANAFTDRAGLSVERRIDPNLPPLDPDVELVVFRVAQESLTNVARHAGASRVELRLESVDGGVRLRVRDYGRGLNGARRGSGVRGMRERALLVGGALSIASRPGAGVEVRLDVPVAERR